MVHLVRLAHGLVSALFLSCLGYVYYCGVTDTRSIWLVLSVIALAGEGAVVALNGGDCPLGFVHQRVGDEKAFFELFLPKRAAKLAVPFLAAVTVVGFGLLLV